MMLTFNLEQQLWENALDDAENTKRLGDKRYLNSQRSMAKQEQGQVETQLKRRDSIDVGTPRDPAIALRSENDEENEKEQDGDKSFVIDNDDEDDIAEAVEVPFMSEVQPVQPVEQEEPIHENSSEEVENDSDEEVQNAQEVEEEGEVEEEREAVDEATEDTLEAGLKIGTRDFDAEAEAEQEDVLASEPVEIL